MSRPDPVDFLRALFAGCQGLLELRALPSKARTFAGLGDHGAARTFVSNHANENVYVAVATRLDASGGDLAHCLHLPALFIDVDFKTTPREQARDAIRRFPLRPSIVVRSGGGVHSYWLLREPVDLREEASRAKDLLRRLALELGGDINAAEPARILRMPGTRNFKYTPPCPVPLTHLDASARYNPIDFDSLLPVEPHNTASKPRFVVPELIAAGARNSTLYRLGRSLKSRGLVEPEILAALLSANAWRCQPPLDDAEVRAIAHNAATQQDRPTFLNSPNRRTDFTIEIWP